MHTLHFSMQGKGGCGKSLVAALVAQYLIEQGTPAAGIDTDPINQTFSQWKALGATALPLLDKRNRVDERQFDPMMETLLSADRDFVVDVGAASFLPWSTYLVENGAIDMLADAGRRVTIHVPVTNADLDHTLGGLVSLVDQMPASVELVVWLNEFFGGPVLKNGKGFEELKPYVERKQRVRAIVRLAQLDPLPKADVEPLLRNRVTFAEALADPEMQVMPKQRIKQSWRAITNQFGPVF